MKSMSLGSHRIELQGEPVDFRVASAGMWGGADLERPRWEFEEVSAT